MAPVIQYFEQENIDSDPIEEAKSPQSTRYITNDLQNLLNAFEQLSKHVEKVDNINNEGQIIQVDEANNLYDHFDKILTNSQYLQNVSEDVIYGAY